MIDKNLCFRPSVTLFVHETGEQVLQQFRAVLELAPVPSSLACGIGLLRVTVDDATGLAEATPEHIGSEVPSGMPDQPGQLEQRVEEMTRYVQGLSTKQRLSDAGYLTPAPVQIYIIGNAHDPWLGSVLKMVRQQLKSFGFDTAVSYLLDCAPLTPGTAPTGASLPPPLGIDWSQRATADFSFLFDDRIVVPQVVFVGEDILRHYIMAAGLFALIATSITIDNKFHELIEHLPGETYDKQGTLRSSVVAFPRAAVERYCSARFGAELMNHWLNSLRKARVSAEESSREREAARSHAENLKESLKDSDLRPNAHPEPENIRETQLDPDSNNAQMDPDIHLWPTLALLQQPGKEMSDMQLQEQHRLHEQLHEDTARLFELFLYEEVEQETLQYRKRTRMQSDVAYDRAGRAPERFTTWRTRAQDAWMHVAGRVTAQVKAQIMQKLPQGDNGVARARIYVDEYNSQISRLQDLTVALREQHERRYEDGLEVYREKAAPWMKSSNTSAILGPSGGPNIAPIFPTQPQQAAAQVPGAGANTPLPQGNARSDPHLTAEEENIAKALRTRAQIWSQSVPAQSSIITSIAMVTGGMGFPLLALLPATLASHPLSSAIIAGISTLAGGSFHFVRRQRQARQAREAELDLLKFFCLCYAYRCEANEDELRVLALGPLRRWVFRRLQQLEDFEAAIERRRDLLNQAADETQDQLFDGPPALFNLFVVHDSQLQRPTQYTSSQKNKDKITLEEVTHNVRDQCRRNNEPEWLWHNHISSIQERFLASSVGSNNVLDMADDEARDHIIDFFRDQVVRAYLVGAFVDAYHALGERGLQKSVIKQMETPLTQLKGVMQPQQIFVCGQQPLPGNVWTDTLRFVLTDEREWYLFMSLFHGNVLSELDIDALFPIA